MEVTQAEPEPATEIQSQEQPVENGHQEPTAEIKESLDTQPEPAADVVMPAEASSDLEQPQNEPVPEPSEPLAVAEQHESLPPPVEPVVVEEPPREVVEAQSEVVQVQQPEIVEEQQPEIVQEQQPEVVEKQQPEVVEVQQQAVVEESHSEVALPDVRFEVNDAAAFKSQPFLNFLMIFSLTKLPPLSRRQTPRKSIIRFMCLEGKHNHRRWTRDPAVGVAASAASATCRARPGTGRCK